MVIVASCYGTSVQVVERGTNKLFFNDNGSARWFTAERLEDARKREAPKDANVKSFKDMSYNEELKNMLLIIQVPLVVPPIDRSCNYTEIDGGEEEDSCLGFNDIMPAYGMSLAQLNLGDFEEKYVGVGNTVLKRDNKYPVRVTCQYYRVTDLDKISEADITDIRDQLNKIERSAIDKGSLVIDTTKRCTESTILPPIEIDKWKNNKMVNF